MTLHSQLINPEEREEKEGRIERNAISLVVTSQVNKTKQTKQTLLTQNYINLTPWIIVKLRELYLILVRMAVVEMRRK